MLLAHEEIDPELGTGIELHEGCSPCQGAALSALHPFLTGDGPAAKLAGGRIEPGARCTPGHPFPPSRLPPEEHLQILVCVGHPCSVIKDFIHPHHPITRRCLSRMSPPLAQCCPSPGSSEKSPIELYKNHAYYRHRGLFILTGSGSGLIRRSLRGAPGNK